MKRKGGNAVPPTSSSTAPGDGTERLEFASWSEIRHWALYAAGMMADRGLNDLRGINRERLKRGLPAFALKIKQRPKEDV